MKPLSNNPAHLDQLCSMFELGTRRGTVAAVPGGFHHSMWKLETHNGTFAVKQLADDMDMKDPATVAQINATELTACEFSRNNIPALHSLHVDRQHLQMIDGVGYLVYPWTHATACHRNGIEEHHAVIVASTLAHMHRSDINVPELRDVPAFPVTADRVITMEGDVHGLGKVPGGSNVDPAVICSFELT